MLKTRLAAANAVKTEFLKAETAVDAAAAHAAACVATMLTTRLEANLPATVGLDALRILSEASNDIVRARQRFVEAHQLLVQARNDLGLRAYGDESDCPDGFTSPMGAEARPRLTAVA